jgi:hypothetical protein
VVAGSIGAAGWAGGRSTEGRFIGSPKSAAEAGEGASVTRSDINRHSKIIVRVAGLLSPRDLVLEMTLGMKRPLFQ